MRVLVGVCGGIAAYKACELVRQLVRGGHDVTPLVTPGASRFVTEETFYALARKDRTMGPYPHLDRADALVIAPLTANTLAKVAHGLADNVLTEAVLAHVGPVIVAPAMNTRMWANAATRENIEILRARGVEIVGPSTGELAEGEVGPGRMAEPSEIYARVAAALGASGEASALTGKRVVVSAGGTREPLDAVRYVGNRSSGRMGVALAAEARRRGAVVTLLAANLSVEAPVDVEVVTTPTAADLAREALARRDADVIVMAAAVADYAPAPIPGKRPKNDDSWTVELAPTLDIAKTLGQDASNGRILVTFGAETGASGLARKRTMLETKGADLVVVNDIGRGDIGFDSADNEVVLIAADGERHVPKAPKTRIAAEILDEVERLLRREHA
jgi:phosphopantothenoylcysteine decarboxylase / phosphopantothenate---cysteine ligase